MCCRNLCCSLARDSRPPFCLFSVIFILIIQILQKNQCENMSIHYLVLGFELTTFWLWVSSYNHWTRARWSLRSNCRRSIGNTLEQFLRGQNDYSIGELGTQNPFEKVRKTGLTSDKMFDPWSSCYGRRLVFKRSWVTFQYRMLHK